MGGSPKNRKPRAPMRAKTARRLGSAVIAAVSLTACTALEPVELPPSKEVLNAPAQFSSPAAAGNQITESLLDLFNDQVLRAAITQALSGNLDIRQSAKRLELAGIDVTTTGTDAWPQLSGNVNASRGSAAGESISPHAGCAMGGRSLGPSGGPAPCRPRRPRRRGCPPHRDAGLGRRAADASLV